MKVAKTLIRKLEQSERITTMSDYELLGNLGLSKTAIACYECLVESGQQPAKELAERLSITRTDLYRVLHHLEAIGFTTSFKSESNPIYFQARPLRRAMERHFLYQIKTLKPLLGDADYLLLSGGLIRRAL